MAATSTSTDPAVLSLLSLSLARAPEQPPKMRRLGSAGASRRRLSDARDAAQRPSLLALSPPPAHMLGASLPVAVPVQRAESVASDDAAPKSAGRKRGQIYVCEHCAKQYKHPSCLIKHRWEHSPHWREASKFVQSKHQQVQLLEAAAILSHLSTSPSGTSLPEDRSLWPSFLSPGVVPPPSGANAPTPPAGPRLHDYSVPARARELRPGLLGVPTPPPGGSFTDSSPGAAFSFGARTPSTPATSVSAGKYGVGSPGSWALPASDLRSSYAEESAVMEEDEEDGDEYAVGRREAEDEWAGDMDMD